MDFNLSTYMVEFAPTYEMGARYLKTLYRDNKERYIKRFEDILRIYLTMHDVENVQDIIKFYNKLFDSVTSYSYEEAFKIQSEKFKTKYDEFRNTVFSVIDVPEMIAHLGSKRIKTSGIELIDKSYNNFKKEFVTKDISQIYELHKVNGKKLGLENEDIYAIKCWCTSTNQEHWLWVDKETGIKGDPLEAIASTCKIYKSMEGNINHIIRQGDVFLFEMNKDIIPEESEEIITLDKDTYFGLLKSQA